MSLPACLDPACLPWNAPVPVRPADFVSLHPEHAELAVQTDLGAIDAFGVAADSQDDLLWSDVQVSGNQTVGRRFGSGRSGNYRGHYLKGIGRTTLAANWTAAGDAYHGTGHMFASAAVREYVSTCVLAAQGASDTIVGCEGVLVRELEPGLREGLRRFEAQNPAPLPEVDRRLQAITVKDGRFARWSNLNWMLLASGPTAPRLANWIYLTELYAGEPHGPLPDPDRVGPASMVRALDGAARRAADHFVRFARCGVNWGSFANNFTLDGRFLDLEVPLLYPAPFLGTFVFLPGRESDAVPQDLATLLPGAEVFELSFQVRVAVSSLVHRLRFLAETAASPLVTTYCDAVCEELETTFHAGHPLLDRDAVVGRAADLLVGWGADRGRVETLLGFLWEEAHNRADGPAPWGRLEPSARQVARSEPIAWTRTYDALDLGRVTPDPAHAALIDEANAILREADPLVDGDALLALLAEVPGRLGASRAAMATG